MGGAAPFGQRADGEPCLLRRALLRRRQRPVHHADHLLRLQRHTCRWEFKFCCTSFTSPPSPPPPPLSHNPPVPFPPGCLLESFPCVRKTLETVKELQGNFMCWKGSKGYSPYTSLCPHYRRARITLPHSSSP